LLPVNLVDHCVEAFAVELEKCVVETEEGEDAGTV
jgi:hypothetical protein